jgi:hypothetical protein
LGKDNNLATSPDADSTRVPRVAAIAVQGSPPSRRPFTRSMSPLKTEVACGAKQGSTLKKINANVT